VVMTVGGAAAGNDTVYANYTSIYEKGEQF
jgi:hypothetical protein